MTVEPTHLRLSVRFLGPAFHGRRDKNLPEWPPSPLRAFQGLVCAASARTRSAGTLGRFEPALRWLESLPPPTVIAPVGAPGKPYCTAVPNNDLDVLAAAWAKGQEPKKQPTKLKTLKSIRPTWMRSGDAVHFLWPLSTSLPSAAHLELLQLAARSLSALGWGIDFVVGDAGLIDDDSIEQLPGERWRPAAEGAAEGGLRVPIIGTLDALVSREAGFRSRLDPGGYYRSPPPLTAFAVWSYRQATAPAARSVAAFALLRPDAGGMCAFDPVRRGLTVAAQLRRAARLAAESAGWPDDRVSALVLGHSEQPGSPHIPAGSRRFAYLPLPSLEWRGAGERVGAIRRAIVTSFSGDLDTEVQWARRNLSGQALVEEQTGATQALLALIPINDRALRRYLEPASMWTTVTPVVLPGFDDPRHYRRRLKQGVSSAEQRELLAKLDARTDALLRRAIVQSGFSPELARYADIDWRKAGFAAGVDLASRYGVPDHLRRFPRLHVKIRWRDRAGDAVSVTGPVCLGGGRHIGLGLCASNPP